MNTVEIKGIIKYDNSEGQRIDLIDGEEVNNLVEEFEFAVRKYGSMVQLNYWISDKPCTKEKMLEAWLNKIFGAIETDCDEVFQGSWTYENHSAVGYNKDYKLQVGGHDLFNELSDQEGKFIIMELNFK